MKLLMIALVVMHNLGGKRRGSDARSAPRRFNRLTCRDCGGLRGRCPLSDQVMAADGAHLLLPGEGQDADKEFLDRLKPLPVRPESDCTQKDTKTFTMSIVDKRTKKSAVLFGLGGILWRSPTEAEVEGSYLCGSQCMAGGVYHLAFDQGIWSVTRFDQRIGQ